MRPELRIGIQTCPGTIRRGYFLIGKKPRNSPGHQIFADPKLKSKRKRRATLIGAGYTTYQPEMIFVDLFRAKNNCGESLVKLQKTKCCLINCNTRCPKGRRLSKSFDSRCDICVTVFGDVAWKSHICII